MIQLSRYKLHGHCQLKPGLFNNSLNSHVAIYIGVHFPIFFRCLFIFTDMGDFLKTVYVHLSWHI